MVGKDGFKFHITHRDLFATYKRNGVGLPERGEFFATADRGDKELPRGDLFHRIRVEVIKMVMRAEHGIAGNFGGVDRDGKHSRSARHAVHAVREVGINDDSCTGGANKIATLPKKTDVHCMLFPPSTKMLCPVM